MYCFVRFKTQGIDLALRHVVYKTVRLGEVWYGYGRTIAGAIEFAVT